MMCLLYLDPSSGSLLYQIVVGGILAALSFWRRPWRALREAWRRKDAGRTR